MPPTNTDNMDSLFTSVNDAPSKESVQALLGNEHTTLASIREFGLTFDDSGHGGSFLRWHNNGFVQALPRWVDELVAEARREAVQQVQADLQRVIGLKPADDTTALKDNPLAFTGP